MTRVDQCRVTRASISNRDGIHIATTTTITKPCQMYKPVDNCHYYSYCSPGASLPTSIGINMKAQNSKRLKRTSLTHEAAETKEPDPDQRAENYNVQATNTNYMYRTSTVNIAAHNEFGIIG